jgi:single-strand DNA-binding protein
MSNETYVTIIGTVTADAEIRFTPSGAAVASFSVATNARKFNKQTNEWEKKPPKFWRCQAWNQGKALLADNIANVLKKGDTVVVYGELETREYVTKEGEKRSADELRVEGIGKDLRWHQAYANDVPPTTSSAGNWGGNQATTPAAQEDPWATPRVSNAGGWGNGPVAEPPF